MAIAKELKDVLACPKCKGELEFREEERKIVCHACQLVYRIEDDIPVMLIDEATSLALVDEATPLAPDGEAKPRP